MSNDIVIEAWNTVLFEKFSRFKFLFVEGYTSISQEVFRRQRLRLAHLYLMSAVASATAHSQSPNLLGVRVSRVASIVPVISSKNVARVRLRNR